MNRTIIVQINNRVCGSLLLDADTSEATAIAAVFAAEDMKSFLDGRILKKVVYVPGNVINLVMSGPV